MRALVREGKKKIYERRENDFENALYLTTIQ